MERSFELLVAVFGVLKAGAAFVAIDPELPVDRQAFLLANARVRIVLTQGHLFDSLREPASMAEAALLAVAPIDTGAPLPTRLPARSGAPVVGESGPAYVIYTSGSTGLPKAIRVPHRALVNHARWFAEVTGLGGSDRMLCWASISFDAALAELFAPILSGARIVLMPPHAHRDLLGLVDRVRSSRVTVMQAVPSVLRAALDGAALGRGFDEVVSDPSSGPSSDPSSSPSSDPPSALRYLVCGGEALDHALVRSVAAAWGDGVRIGNFYGPSEACVDAAMHEVDAATLRRRTIPIGRPIANARCYVVDRSLQPVPIGAVGELVIGGRGLALDYLGQPELTARRFVPDPFRPGERLYRTGDLARITSDGMLEYLGRNDSQVKVRGFRLELAEIEAALRGHPGVREVAVVAPVGADGERELVAWLTLEPNAPVPSRRAITSRVRQSLPAYAVPSYVGVLPSLPLTSSGKLDRGRLEALPRPASVGDAAGDPGSDDRNPVSGDPMTLRILALWEEVLGVRPLGLDDGFFDMGGHSLKAIRLLNEVDREFGIDVHPGVLFEAPTVRAFAQRLQQRATAPVSKIGTTIVPVHPQGRRPPLFFVPGGAGELLVFAAISDALGKDQPLHVVDLYAFENRAELGPSPSLPDIVACIVADLRRCQPTGPYHLAGYSMGGNIALEMAHQLRASGEEIATLVLLDADGPGYPHLEPLPRRLGAHARHALGLGPRGLVSYVRQRWPRVLVRLKLRSEEPHRLFVKEEGLDLVPREVVETMERAVRPVIDAWERYVPEPYPAPVTLVRAEVRQLMVGVRDDDPQLGWGSLLPDLRVVDLPVDHFELLRAPNAGRLARVLTECMDRTGGASLRNPGSAGGSGC